MADKITRTGLTRRGSRERFTATVTGDVDPLNIPITSSGTHDYAAGSLTDSGNDISRFFTHLVIHTAIVDDGVGAAETGVTVQPQVNALSSSNTNADWVDLPHFLIGGNQASDTLIADTGGILFIEIPAPGVAVRLKTGATAATTSMKITVLLANSSERSDIHRS